MKVLITGANGFVGSHILDRLRADGVAVAVLLRGTSDTLFIEGHLDSVDVHYGSLADPGSIRRAMEDASHVIHCAGKTKAARAREYYEVNRQGTRHVVEAVNKAAAGPGSISRLLLISSLAATGPATALTPVREDAHPAPVSHYGRSKLEAEEEVREGSQVEFTILRPSAVYGPSDRDLLSIFKAVRAHLRPLIGGGQQPLSLLYVGDLAAAVVECLTRPEAAGGTYNVASPEVVTSGALAREIAELMGAWTVPLPLPTAALWPVCLALHVAGLVSGKPHILNLQKYREIRAPGWVCDVARLREEIGFVAPTSLQQGLAETIRWYRHMGWL
ncbi:MAG: NAD(P)-dependent oxidoreductase [Candidatus Brocadiia bacterium]|nr:NAD(P)-dependent oxidoreductase [Candidatus Brocadiia bacterium]